MMKAMLKPQGVMAICIDDNELFHLGMLMDEVFGEENRIAIINWQKAYAAKNDSKHISTATEYVLVYAREKQLAKTGLTPRTEATDAKYTNPDNDPIGRWRNDNPTRREPRDHDKYGFQSPFTGAIHYPGATSWRLPKERVRELLEMWGSRYIEKDIRDGRARALVIRGAAIPATVVKTKQNLDHFPVIEMGDTSENKVNTTVRKKAEAIRDGKVWPMLYFGRNGKGRPNLKRYLARVQKGKVALTYWADDEYDEPLKLGTQSWDHEESGHSQTGINELNAIVGKGHKFDTVKPLKLMKKIIQLWCPANGLLMDPYAGSGTTGHATLELNHEAGTDRRFILVEQGHPEKGDKYARTLTHTRLKRVILGLRPNKIGRVKKTAKPLGGGFEFRALTNQIDAKTVLSMRRDELVDVMITSHWETGRRNSPNLIRVEDPAYRYLVGKNERGEGYFIIWPGDGPIGQLDADTYRVVLEEGKKADLKPPYHVYARYEVYQSKNVFFYKIPDKILAHLGLNENSDRYNEAPEGE